MFDAAVARAGPCGGFVAEDESEGVLFGMPVRISCLHEDVEILRFEVRGVSEIYKHVVKGHRIFDFHSEGQRFGGLPGFLGQCLYVAVIYVFVTAAQQQ